MQFTSRDTAYRLASSEHAVAEQLDMLVGRTREISALMGEVLERFERAHAEFESRLTTLSS